MNNVISRLELYYEETGLVEIRSDGLDREQKDRLYTGMILGG
ncbi:MAG: hypothetical protein ACLUTZ_13495 [Oliverpabstia sp.]